MRKISANLILPVSSPPLRNGIIILNPDGSIAELVDTGGTLHEESGLEFYPGIITPGFILPWFRLDEYSKSLANLKTGEASGHPESRSIQDNLNLIEKLESELFRNGIKGIGLVLPESMASNEGFERMSKSSLFFHPVIELCPERDEDEFEVFNRGIDLISHTWNEFNLACSLTACSQAMEYCDIGKFIDEYGRSHKNMHSPEGNNLSNQLPSDGMQFNLLKKSLARNPDMNFEDLILGLTLDAASRIFEEEELGRIEKGKKPGLNLVSGYSDSGRDSEWTKNITLKVLV